MIVSAVHAHYGLSGVSMDGLSLNARQMDALAETGRREAQVNRSHRANGRKIFSEEDGVAIIPVEGVLVSRNGLDPYSGMTGYDGIEQKLIAAEADPQIKAKCFLIDSGGGDVTQLFDLVDLIWAMNKKNGGKLTYAILADHAYSAAYAIASACDKVWVPRTGGAGSVGVITMHADFSQKNEEEGVKVTIIRAGKNKFRSHPYEPLEEEALAHIQGQCDEIRDIFIETVARNMGISKKTVRDTEALDYMGNHAKAIGFVNEVGSAHQAWHKLQQAISR